MPFLVILKRFEVWMLLLTVAALLVFAFRNGPSETGPDAETPPKKPEADTLPQDRATIAETGDEVDAPVAVGGVEVIPSPGGFIVETELLGYSPTGRDLLLDEKGVKASTEEGAPVPRFFEPFRTHPTLAAAGNSNIELRWWLEAKGEAIWIEVGDRRLKAELP